MFTHIRSRSRFAARLARRLSRQPFALDLNTVNAVLLLNTQIRRDDINRDGQTIARSAILHLLSEGKR